MIQELVVTAYLFCIIVAFTVIGLVAILIDSIVDAFYRQPLRGWLGVGVLVLAYHWRML
jgi:phosphotransferase system  glucose/maltose/N-acetylglucosamine-specific IIC component